MRIALATDHAGFPLKGPIAAHLRLRGHEVVDFGTDTPDPCDYPRFMRPAAEAVAAGTCARAIVLGGSGNGEAIVANRVAGVRCAYCFSVETATLGRAHNDANAIALGARLVSTELALAIVDAWLETPFEGGRHQRRIEMIDHPV
ncbi:MAG: ribose 5-phosphate isomerase B [Planctomycetes bacterium]|nr:ribose 5-phosphate isomerase B [Planctomycetota bacterium]